VAIYLARIAAHLARIAARRTSVISAAPVASASVIVVAACALALAACGAPRPGHSGAVTSTSAGAGSGTASASPGRLVTVPVSAPAPAHRRTIMAGARRTVTLTARDNGATVLLSTGQAVRVSLAGDGIISWHRPAVPAAKSGVLRRVSASGGYPGRRPARATFRAVRPGTALISSITDARCLHASPPCEIAQRLWQVTVIVTS